MSEISALIGGLTLLLIVWGIGWLFYQLYKPTISYMEGRALRQDLNNSLMLKTLKNKDEFLIEGLRDYVAFREEFYGKNSNKDKDYIRELEDKKE